MFRLPAIVAEEGEGPQRVAVREATVRRWTDQLSLWKRQADSMSEAGR